MSKYSMVVVCVLAFIVGGVAAVVVHHSPRGADSAQDVAGRNADDDHGEGGENAAATGEVVKDTDTEQRADAAGDGASDPDGDVGSPASRLRRRAATTGSAGDSARVKRVYARGSAGRAASGGRGVAGHMVGGVKKTGAGVKKTGAVIGKTFGKIGGVFHE